MDHLLTDGRYRTAVREYDKLLKELPEEEKLLSTAIYHNKGVAFSRLFWYEKAAEMFEEAYRRNGEEEELTAFLTAKRMQLPEKEYVAFVTGSPDYYEASMQLEQRLEKAAEDWQQSEEKRNTEELLFKRQTEEASYYYSEMAKTLKVCRKNTGRMWRCKRRNGRRAGIFIKGALPAAERNRRYHGLI